MWRLLESTGQSRLCKRGTILTNAGENWPYLMRVQRGEIQLVKVSADGRSLIPQSLRTGDLFWGRPLTDDEPMPVAVQAATHAEVMLWPFRHLLPAVQSNPQALWDLLRIMSNQVHRAADYLAGLAFQPLSLRLARLVLQEFEPVEGFTQSRSLTLEQMAAHIGTNREVVCRLLHSFEADGLIQLSRTELAITHLDGLRRVAGYDREETGRIS